MLPMFWEESHHALRASAEAWVSTAIRPRAEEWEEAGSFPRELHGEAGAVGLLGVGYPEELGGQGGDVFHRLIVAEALIRGGSAGVAMGLGTHAIVVPPIEALGDEGQRQRWIPPLLRGERVACLAVTEPGAGSDVAGMRTRAEPEGGGWRISGQKTFITSGLRADFALVLCRTGEDRHGGLTFFIVPAGTPGFEKGRALRKMGWWASDTAELYFDQCWVPDEQRIGDEGSGFLGLMANFVGERLLLSASAVAVMGLAIAECERHLAQREAFGRPIGSYQVLRHRLADMLTDESAARAHTAVVAERWRRGEDITADVAMAKNHATEACHRVCDAAVQIFGGMGYMRESLVERLYRDQRIFSIGGGTTEIMRELIWRRRGA